MDKDKGSMKSLADLLGQGAVAPGPMRHSAKTAADAVRKVAEDIRDAEERTFKSNTGASITRREWLDELQKSERRAATNHQALRNRNYHALLGQTLNSVSSVAPIIQQTAIKNLEQIFKKFTDAEVNVYAQDQQPIGPRIGIESVPEPTLKALAGFEVQRRGRISDRKWHILGGGLAALVTGVVAWVVRGLLGS